MLPSTAVAEDAEDEASEPAMKVILEQITVTAQKREEKLQDVSIAVTALDGEDLADGQIDNIESLQERVPGMIVGDDFALAKLFIRGIGLSTGFPGIDSSVALHVDGAVISQPYAQLGTFFDLDRIEVLRGPQGTLYGRNATGGSVNLITRKPTPDFGGYARLTVGSHELVLAEGALSGPIASGIRGRVAFKSLDRAGYGINEFDGRDVDDADKQAFRGHLQFDLGDAAELLLSGEWSGEDDAGLGLKFLEVTTTLDPRLPPAPGVGGFPTGERNIASETDYRNDRDTWTLNGALSWQLNDRLSLEAITNYRELDVLLKQDLDFSAAVNDDVQTIVTESEQFSQEIQLHFGKDRLQGLAGLYYFSEDFVNVNNGGFERASDGTQTFSLFTGDIELEASAAFAHIRYDVSDRIALNFGGRFSTERRSGEGSLFFRFSVFGGTDRDQRFSDSRSFDDFSPRIGIEWRPAGDTLAYLTYSEGFKSGAFSSGQLVPVLDPELIENFEIGLKTTHLEGRLQLNLAGFFYEITDLQVNRTLPVAGGALATVFENAAAAEGRGVELEASWLATDRFRLDGFVAYLDAEFTDYVTATNLTAVPMIVDLAGNRLRQSPEWSGYLRGEYGFSTRGGGYLSFGADVAYKDDQFYTEFNDDITGQKAHTLVNANIRYTAASGKFSVDFWGRNVTDEFVRSGVNPLASTRTIGATFLPPATAGVTFEYRF